jgi:hypothetical protein
MVYRPGCDFSRLIRSARLTWFSSGGLSPVICGAVSEAENGKRELARGPGTAACRRRPGISEVAAGGRGIAVDYSRIISTPIINDLPDVPTTDSLTRGGEFDIIYVTLGFLRLLLYTRCTRTTTTYPDYYRQVKLSESVVLMSLSS